MFLGELPGAPVAWMVTAAASVCGAGTSWRRRCGKRWESFGGVGWEELVTREHV